MSSINAILYSLTIPDNHGTARARKPSSNAYRAMHSHIGMHRAPRARKPHPPRWHTQHSKAAPRAHVWPLGARQPTKLTWTLPVRAVDDCERFSLHNTHARDWAGFYGEKHTHTHVKQENWRDEFYNPVNSVYYRSLSHQTTGRRPSDDDNTREARITNRNPTCDRLEGCWPREPLLLPLCHVSRRYSGRGQSR